MTLLFLLDHTTELQHSESEKTQAETPYPKKYGNPASQVY